MPINPAVDARLMPGGFNGISTGGSSERPIESFYALAFDAGDAVAAYSVALQGRPRFAFPLGPKFPRILPPYGEKRRLVFR